MPIEPISREWLFKHNSERQIRRWATSLQYFRFCRAYGGHANDGDEFVVALRIDSEQDLLTVAEQLGCALVSLPPDVPRPEPGRAYRVEEFNRFPSPIDDFPQWEQPGSRSINGHPAFVWVKNGALEIHLSGADGDSFAVTEADFQGAKSIEEVLSGLQKRAIDPPIASALCICPKFYGDYWRI